MRVGAQNQIVAWIKRAWFRESPLPLDCSASGRPYGTHFRHRTGTYLPVPMVPCTFFDTSLCESRAPLLILIWRIRIILVCISVVIWVLGA